MCRRNTTPWASLAQQPEHARALAASVKAQGADASEWLQAHGGQVADITSPCPIHGVPMHQNPKDGRTWYRHKTADS